MGAGAEGGVEDLLITTKAISAACGGLGLAFISSNLTPGLSLVEQTLF